MSGEIERERVSVCVCVRERVIISVREKLLLGKAKLVGMQFFGHDVRTLHIYQDTFF